MSRIEGVDDLRIMREYVLAIFEHQGKDLYRCWLCNKKLKRIGDIHHTKYDEATLYDLVISCKSCQVLQENRGLE